MLEGLDVEIAQVDLARPETLEAALTGVDKTYFVASGPAIRLFENVYSAPRARAHADDVRSPAHTGGRASSVVPRAGRQRLAQRAI
jgi:uncharacterized protein YbjT (DUF2867 family)